MLALLPAAALGVWTLVGLAGENVKTVAADPSDASAVYAGTNTGVFKSNDEGESWRLIGSRTDCSNVAAVAIDQTTPDVVYAGTLSWGDENCYAGNGDGLFRSDDAGESWSSVASGPVTFLKTPAAVPGRVYAFRLHCLPGFFLQCSSEMMRSDDFGGTFAPSFPLPSNFLEVEAFDIDRSNPLRLWATGFGGEVSGLFRSDDGGETSTQVNDTSGVLGGNYAGLIAVDPRDGKALLLFRSAGTFRSADGGSRWVASSPASLGITEFLFDLERRGVVYGIANGDVVRSVDDGISWALFGSAISNAVQLSESADGQRLYAATDHGVFVLGLDAPPARSISPVLPATPVVVVRAPSP